MVTKMSKIEVLESYWDKMIGVVQHRATALKDKKMTDVCKEILLVPHDVKHEILELYLRQCMRLHAIAFAQWRLK